MKVQVEDVSPVVKRLAVEVPPERVNEALAATYKRLSRTVKLKGYRPGHAPRHVLERHFKNEVEQDVARMLVEETISRALSERDIVAVAPPVVSNDAVEPGKVFKYSARVEVKPQVDPKDYEGLEVKREQPSVTDADVESELQKLREAQAQVVPVTGRDTVELGDLVVIDYEGLVDGKPFRGGKGEGVTLLVGEGGAFIEGFAPMLAGVPVHKPVDVEYTFPADYRVPDLRGKTATFHVTVQQIKKKELPRLDDELARDLGAESLEALRARVKKDLQERAAERAEAEFKEALQKALVDKNPIDVPPAMVDRAVGVLIEGAAQGFARAGVDLRKALDVERLAAEMRPRAELMLKAQLLLEGVARKEKLEAGDADVEEHVQKIAAESHLPVEKVRAHYRDPEHKNALLARLRQDKALAFLISRAKIV